MSEVQQNSLNRSVNLVQPPKNNTETQPIVISSSDSDNQSSSNQSQRRVENQVPQVHWQSSTYKGNNGQVVCDIKIVRTSDNNRVYHLYMNAKLGGNAISDTYISKLQEPKLNENQRFSCKVVEKKKFEDYLNLNKPDQKNKITMQMKNQVLLWLKMKHNNLVEFVDYVETKNNYYFFMHYNEIGNLQALLTKKKFLMENNALFIFKQLVEGAKYLADMGIIHTDIRPSNVLLHVSNNNQAIIARITDFGFSKFIETQPSTYKLQYQSPQLLTNQKYSYLCDVWSLGIILYEMITGNLPWNFSLQVTNAKQFYDQIQNQKLEFPQNLMIGQDVKVLITEMLQFKEEDRIAIQQVLKQVNKIIQVRITRMELE